MGNSHRVSTGTLAAPVAQVTDENLEAYSLKPTWNKVAGADFYEIEFNNMLYDYQNTELLFDGLEAETDYAFKIRSVNKDGYSDWSSFNVKTKSNPLEFCHQRESAKSNCRRAGVVSKSSVCSTLLNWETCSIRNTRKNAIPFDMIIDLRTVNQLDKFHYLSRQDGGNGTMLRGFVSYSMDKENWIPVDSFKFERNGDVKIFEFKDKPKHANQTECNGRCRQLRFRPRIVRLQRYREQKATCRAISTTTRRSAAMT